MKRDPTLYLEDIISVCRRIEDYTAGLTFEDFRADDMTVDAVVWNIKVISEAAGNIPSDVRMRMPEVAWNDASALRDAVIHDVTDVDLPLVWEIVRTKAAPLANQISAYLKTAGR
jgi:uncharacterized protein with HEPN domain